MNKKRIIACFMGLIGGIVIFVYWFQNGEIMKERLFDNNVVVHIVDQNEDLKEESDNQNSSNDENKLIKVYISGAVVKPGVYEMSDGDRIIDLIAKAEGFTEEAETEQVNMAALLFDEQHIVIYKKGDMVDKNQNNLQNDISYQLEADSLEKVNINRADREQLQTLPGIGSVIADAIIEYRDMNGEFQSIEEIMNVYRIGEKTFERLKDKITVK